MITYPIDIEEAGDTLVRVKSETLRPEISPRGRREVAADPAGFPGLATPGRCTFPDRSGQTRIGDFA